LGRLPPVTLPFCDGHWYRIFHLGAATKPLTERDKPACSPGHIDLLQARNTAIHILDYNPRRAERFGRIRFHENRCWHKLEIARLGSAPRLGGPIKPRHFERYREHALSMTLSLFLVAPAFAQSPKPVTFQCTTDKDGKTLKATGTNPNLFDKTCDVTCYYTTGDKAQKFQSWSGVLLHKNCVNELMGENHGGKDMKPPLTNISAKGTCK
jgi:hypothetical protein